jgi:pimeloyl-ACP methyl ester carboxylesterase
MEIKHRFVETNGIRMQIAEAGCGPLVVLCHGFPETSHSFRHQVWALSEAGFHAVAPDQRGYGRTDRPEAVDRYTLLHMVGDLVGLVDALAERTAFLVGHDWGAPVVWQAALMRPDRFPAVAGLSVPFLPRPRQPPTTLLPRTESAVHYQLYFQEPGVAEAELEHDPHATLRRVLYGASGDAPLQGALSADLEPGMVPRGGGMIRRAADPEVLPPWLTRSDIDHAAAEFARSGFCGALNWYRNMDRNWELLAPWADAQLTVPALYMAGDRDLVLRNPLFASVVENLQRVVPTLKERVILPGCGHWTQQERPAEVNATLIRFLREVTR